MPELPEVETIRRDLLKKIKGQKIDGVVVKKDNMVKGHTKTFIRKIKGQTIKNISRIGKLMIFDLGNDLNLLVHLKMTGQLVFVKGDKVVAGGHNIPKADNRLPNKYSHIIFTLADDSKLFFNDLRQFGYMRLVSNKIRELLVVAYGIEPLTDSFTLDNFKKVFNSRQTSVKAILLNQKLIAGIGNIYADEICHQAGIKPTRQAGCLTQAEIKNIYLACQIIIKKAIRHRGTTFNDYVDASGKEGNFVKLLKVYGREGQVCQRCRQAKIKKIKITGRGTHLCPKCQK